MKIVVDANVVFAALTKNSITRELLLYLFIKYYSPDFLLSELQKHKKELMAKSHLSDAAYGETIRLLLSNVKVVSRFAYGSEIKRALKVIGYLDKDDVAYLALSAAIEADGIWTYDKHFEKQREVKALKTKDIAVIVKQGKKI
jgi:predicted nucleic acid-binding protein